MDSLFGIELDPSGRLDAFLPNLSRTLKCGRSTHLHRCWAERPQGCFIHRKRGKGGIVVPGLDEAMAFDELLRFVEDPNWDAVVLTQLS